MQMARFTCIAWPSWPINDPGCTNLNFLRKIVTWKCSQDNGSSQDNHIQVTAHWPASQCRIHQRRKQTYGGVDARVLHKALPS